MTRLKPNHVVHLSSPLTQQQIKLRYTYTNPQEAELVYAEMDRFYRILSRARIKVREQINAWKGPR